MIGNATTLVALLGGNELFKSKANAPTFGDAQLAETDLMVEERRWGYVLNAPGMTYAELNLSQRLSVLVAAYLLSFGIACVIPVLMGMPSTDDILCQAAAVFFAALAMPFAWYATRGNKAYIYVNTYRNELREVVPNMIGKPTVLRRMPFSDIGGVRIDHQGAGERALLLLWQGGEWRRIAVLEGCRRELTTLREKLARDVFRTQLSDITLNPANIAELPAFFQTDSVHARRIA